MFAGAAEAELLAGDGEDELLAGDGEAELLAGDGETELLAGAGVSVYVPAGTGDDEFPIFENMAPIFYLLVVYIRKGYILYKQL